MNPSRPRKRRLPVALACSAATILVLLSACEQDVLEQQVTAVVKMCAIDPVQKVCNSGNYQAIGKSQVIRIQAVDKSGKALAKAKVTLKVSGANATTQSLTTGSDGAATYTYTGAKAGDDKISAAVDVATSAMSPGPVVVRWLKPTSYIHPIIFVHGINEDAADFTVQMHKGFTDPDQASDASEQTFTALFEALTLKYDPKYLEALCYVDDHAYDHNSAPSGCRFPLDTATYSTACVPGSSNRPCQSQGSVDENALQLARTVDALSAEAAGAGSGTAKVTLIAYSMGGAVVRSFLAGCRAPQAPYTTQRCQSTVGKIDHVFFIDGDQQGSWLLTINKGYNAAELSGDSSIPSPITPFASALPIIQKTLYDRVKSAVGLDATSKGVQDQTPQSPSILAHDQEPIPPGIDVYNFFGNVQIRMGVTVYGLPIAPGVPTLNLGDFVMLAQNNSATLSPLWGGGGLCDGCASALAGYRENSPQFHNWALIDTHSVDASILADFLRGTFDPKSAAGKFVNSPVQHLNITQPPIQSPGTLWPVRDITGRTDKTDMSTEIFYILTKADGVALP
jgi:pimeloyl-ACP methyl ester carboxylesterase